MNAGPTVLFELNEVPWRIVDWWCEKRPGSALARLLPGCRRYETIAEDPGHLSPWLTWPSLHRGIGSERHGIVHLGQPLREPDAAFPSIWTILAAHGVRVGVFGSLHSHPVPEVSSSVAFHVPDTFAAGSESLPRTIEPFQRFNLRAARANALHASAPLPWGDAVRFLARAPLLGLTPRTAAILGAHLAQERLEPWKRARRRTMQSVLAFDLFMHQLRVARPSFATFFTNHVASTMHRFWAATFPGDYEAVHLPDEWLRRFSGEIEFVMAHADAMIARLVAHVGRTRGRLVIATSMGQAATQARHVESLLGVESLERFLEGLGVPRGEWSRQPAMFPQVNVVVRSPWLDALRRGLSALRLDGHPIEWDEREDGFFSISLGQINPHLRPAVATLAGRDVSYEELGLAPVRNDELSGSSAYHVPQGMLLVHDAEAAIAPSRPGARTQVSTLDVAPWLLASHGIPPLPHMRRPAKL